LFLRTKVKVVHGNPTMTRGNLNVLSDISWYTMIWKQYFRYVVDLMVSLLA